MTIQITNKTKMIETNSILTENLGLVGGREPLDVVSHDVDHLTVLTAQRHHYDKQHMKNTLGQSDPIITRSGPNASKMMSR